MKIFYFAHIARALDRREEELSVPAALDTEALWERLVARHPTLGRFRGSAKFVRNGEYAADGERFADGDEVGVLPPVSGG
jgi:molybdopterin converting factor small subunit